MKNLPKSLLFLAKQSPAPLYVVGGAVRDHLAGLQANVCDWDICSPLPADEFATLATKNGFTVKSIYKNTGTVKLHDQDKTDFEYTCFRSDRYVRGVHVPVETFFTDDISLDALRRDFTANAVYYDVANDAFVDPLGGIPAIREKRLTTVAPARKVFGEDGLRLMRLARQAAQLGFEPDEDCLDGASENAALIGDISPERIFSELTTILIADKKYGVENAVYHGLTLLEKTGVLAHILPELALGKGMAQRADFHKYDVLEHSIRTAAYSDERVRLAALLHDVGKPFCALRDGNVHEHPTEGKRLAKEILQRLKAPKKVSDEVCELVEYHMYDLDCKVREKKLRRFLVSHVEILDKLLLLKQADFSACTDDFSTAPTCARWQTLRKQMQEENVPFTLKELAVNGVDLLSVGIPPYHLSQTLKQLLLHTAAFPEDNVKERLAKLAVGIEKSL